MAPSSNGRNPDFQSGNTSSILVGATILMPVKMQMVRELSPKQLNIVRFGTLVP